MKLKKPNKERIALEIAKIVGISVEEIKNDYIKQLNKKYKERIIKYEDSVLREKLATSKGGRASQLVGGPSKAGKASNLKGNNFAKWAKENPEDHKQSSSKAGKASQLVGGSSKGGRASQLVGGPSKAGKASQLVGGPSKAGKASANSPDNVNNQKWECPDGKVTNLVWRDRYCKKRNLDISKCERIK